MAKKGGKSKGYVSAGINSNVANNTKSAMRKASREAGDKLVNQLEAFAKGKRVMVTIANPNKEETNKPFIRVDATTVWSHSSKYRYPSGPERKKTKAK